jgi:hypothetical protein
MSEEELVGPIIGASISIAGGIWSMVNASRSKRDQDRTTVQAMMNKTIELAMQYPHLERDDYCNSWPNPQGAVGTPPYQDDRDRYDNYCCFVFNMIHTAWVLAGKKPCKIEEMLSFREYVLRHRCWWEKEDGNVHFYEQEFRNFINTIIDEDKRKAVCK